jgi:ribose 5-phosphate isomerase B
MQTSFDKSLPIAIGCDHAGYAYKMELVKWLQGRGFVLEDHGCYSADSVDYPDVAHPLASSVEAGKVAFGILLCGSANGVAITANKHQGVRAALCWQNDIAKLARQHNNANVICLPARFISLQQAMDMIDFFAATDFEGGRHANRVNKISC